MDDIKLAPLTSISLLNSCQAMCLLLSRDTELKIILSTSSSCIQMIPRSYHVDLSRHTHKKRLLNEASSSETTGNDTWNKADGHTCKPFPCVTMTMSYYCDHATADDDDDQARRHRRRKSFLPSPVLLL